MQAFGLTEEDFAADNTVEIWPEHEHPLTVFRSLSTQWNVGANGPVGLRYETLPEIWRRTKTAPSDRDYVFACLQVMESAALEEIGRTS